MSTEPRTPAILRRLLEAAGYRLEDRPPGVLAVRGRDRRGILIVDGRRAPTELEGEFPPDLIHRTLLYSEDPGSLARELASSRGFEILDGSSLGPALGELLLPGPEAAPTPPPEAGSTTLEPPALVVPQGDCSVRPRLERRDAEAMAGVEGYRCTLRWIPHFVAPYRVRTATARGASGPASDHVVAVNALTGKVEIWEPNDRELVAGLVGPGARSSPALSEAEARELAEVAIRRRHTVSVDHTEQHAGAIVIERRRLPPGPDDLRLGPSVVVYVPYWYLEGRDGRIVLDAVTGARATPTESELPGEG
ncbi:MAG TPA: hypothetical protein VGS18_00145 [Thermoplasmata archaeon]|nr:hypothetical protein [Thermoplasmata archaeon]